MLNFRRISKKIYLSGGWTDLEKDVKYLSAHNIKSVIDLQWTPDDEHESLTRTIDEALVEEGIDYEAFVLYDNEYNMNAKAVFEQIAEAISDSIDVYSGKREFILIKCGAGLSRSVTAYLFYLCIYERLSFPEAYDKYLIDHLEYNPYFSGTPHAINVYFWNLLKKLYPDSRVTEIE